MRKSKTFFILLFGLYLVYGSSQVLAQDLGIFYDPSLYDQAVHGCIHHTLDVRPEICEIFAIACEVFVKHPRSHRSGEVQICTDLLNAVKGIRPSNPPPSNPVSPPPPQPKVIPPLNEPDPQEAKGGYSVDDIIKHWNEKPELNRNFYPEDRTQRLTNAMSNIRTDTTWKDILKLLKAISIKYTKPQSYRIRSDGFTLNETRYPTALRKWHFQNQSIVLLYWVVLLEGKFEQRNYSSLNAIKSELQETRDYLVAESTRIEKEEDHYTYLRSLNNFHDRMKRKLDEIEEFSSRLDEMKKLLDSISQQVESLSKGRDSSVSDLLKSLATDEAPAPGSQSIRAIGHQDIVQNFNQPDRLILAQLNDLADKIEKAMPTWKDSAGFASRQSSIAYFIVGAVEGLSQTRSGDPKNRLNFITKIRTLQARYELDQPRLGEDVRWFAAYKDSCVQLDELTAEVLSELAH